MQSSKLQFKIQKLRKTFHFKLFTFNSSLGQSLIELLMAIGLSALLLPALITGIIASREGKAQQKERQIAIGYMREVQEVVRVVRENGWASFAVNGTYYPQRSGGTWVLTACSGACPSVDGFTRQVDISNVNRDVNGAIVLSGGTVDPSTKQIVTAISWTQPYTSSITSTTYLTRWLENASYTETTQTQFNAGTNNGVAVQATNPPAVSDDGEIILGSGGHSNWCTPVLDATTLDLPKNGVANAVYAIEGNAYAATGENSSGVSFAKVNIGLSPPYPPTPSLANTFDGYKTNGVFGEMNYAYLATDNNGKEGVIIDLNTVVSGKYQESGYLDSPGNGDGNSIYVASNIGYLTVGNKLYNFDLSSKSGSRPLLDSTGVTLAGTGNSVVVIGGYAYVAIGGASTEMQIIDLSNSSNLTVVGQADVNGQAAYDVYVNSTGTRAYLATGISASQREMFIVDVSTKTGSRPILGSYESNGMDPNALTIVPGNRLILVGTSAEEYQVVDISNESSPIRCGGLQINNGINDVASILEQDNDAFSYVLVGADPEFRIVEGGPGGSYTSTGTFESQTFNPGYSTANNRLTATFSEPSNTNIQFQVSLAALVSGSCPTAGNYTFVGPDGTSATYYNQASGEAITFPFASYLNYSNPGQCFRYKAFFSTTDQTSTPVLNDVIINYSP